MESKPSPHAWFFSSRKGLLTLFAFVVALIFAVLVGVKVAQDKLTLEAGLAFIGGGLLGFLMIVFKAIDAISKEDVAEKSAPKDGAS